MSQPADCPPIADYGLIGDMHTCALVSRAGSIDWACFPRFDSASVFGRILDWQKGGYFSLAPRGLHTAERSYLEGTNVLETTYETATGRAVLTDFMPVTAGVEHPRPRELRTRRQIVRMLRCERGAIDFEMRCEPRFDYGGIMPHVRLIGEYLGIAHGGKDAISVYCSVPMRETEAGFLADGTLHAGGTFCAAVTYEDDVIDQVEPLDDATLETRLEETVRFWQEWSGRCTYKGEYRGEVVRSALTLKALTYAPTGAMIAAPTTSLPEVIGGVRNWDYRYTWIRDAGFGLYALSILGYRDEAQEFKRWLEWSTLGRAGDLQVMYGLSGERRLTEFELPHLEGYRNSRPVRIGNGAHSQFQLDIYGEIVDSAHLYRRYGGDVDPEYWTYLRRVVEFVVEHWQEPDDSIWEPRAERRQYVFSKVMCWVALDRAIRAARALDLPGDVEHWRAVRREIRDDVLAKGYDAEAGSFVQSYGSKALDASLLMLPLVRFLPATDPRMRSTIAAIEKGLATPEGLVYRYRGVDDGLGGREGAFLMCSFWLVDNLLMIGAAGRARALFENLRTYGNDLDLYSEQIDPSSFDLLGNFPQAFTHMGLINAAVQLERAESRAEEGR
jgi:GH15 family glucan-1,4-alpha-glucosidase